jgi:4-carboxymuconolactone decarboxylase
VHLERPKAARVEPVPRVAEKLAGRTKAINVQATMAHHRGLSKALGRLYEVILNECETPRRQRELVILRTGWNCGAEYEFGQHTIYGIEAGGLTDGEVLAATRPISSFPWSPEDRTLLQMADELYTDFCITDTTWAELTRHWSTEEILEFMCAALGYFIVSGLLNSLGVELDKGVPGWPAAVSGS